MTKEQLFKHVTSLRSLLSTVKPTSKDATHRNNLTACYNELDSIYTEMGKLGISNYGVQWRGEDGNTGRSQIYDKLQKKDLLDAYSAISSHYTTIIREIEES